MKKRTHLKLEDELEKENFEKYTCFSESYMIGIKNGMVKVYKLIGKVKEQNCYVLTANYVRRKNVLED